MTVAADAQEKLRRERKWTRRLEVASLIGLAVLLLVAWTFLLLALLEPKADSRRCERAERHEREALMLADWSRHPDDVADAANATESRIRRCGQTSGGSG